MNDVIPSIHGAVMRGTTPTIIYDLGFDVSEITSLKMYFMQGNKVVFAKELSDCTAEEGLIYTQLTQEDTYKLSAKKRLEIRCRFKRNDSPVVGTIASYYDVIDSGKPEFPLTPTKRPVRIEITVLPDKIRYEDGEDISIDGIEVRAYYEDDTEWGIVPFEELTFSPTTAAEGDIWTSGDGVTAIKAQFMQQTVVAPDGVTQGTANLWNHLSIGTVQDDKEGYYYPYIQANDDPQTIYLTKYNGLVYCASETPVSAQSLCFFYSAYHNRYYWYGASTSSDITDSFHGTGCIDNFPFPLIWDGIPESTKDPSGIGLDILHSTQTITVSWDRGDGTILTDDYEIKVGGDDIWTDGDGLYAYKIQYGREWIKNYWIFGSGEGYGYIYPKALGENNGTPVTVGSRVGSEKDATLFLTRYDNKVYGILVSGDNFEFNPYQWNGTLWEGIGSNGQNSAYVWQNLGLASYLTYIPTSTKNPTTVDPGDLHPL